MLPAEKDPTAPSSSLFNFEPEVRRTKQISAIKFLLGCFLYFAGIAATIGLITIANQALQFVSFSNGYLYQNQTLDAVTNRSLVVRPLIDDDQTFDLAVTIWRHLSSGEIPAQPLAWYNLTAQLLDDTAGANSTSPANATSTIWRHLSKKISAQPSAWHNLSAQLLNDTASANSTSPANATSTMPDPVFEFGFERALYSDTIFKGLRLKDEHVFADVKFSIPTKTFLGEWLHPNVLYASIMLIPNSPSLLDYVDTVSTLGLTWVRRSNPFPLGSNNTKYNRTTPTERVLQAMGLQLPLIQLLEIASACETSTDPFTSELLEPDIDDSNFGGGIYIGPSPPRNNVFDRKNHPFIITRSHIVAAQETHLLNRKAFDAARKRFRNEQFHCLGDACKRKYSKIGNLETLLKLSIPSVTGNRMEYAYGPYLSSVPIAGPMDLFQVPINRENCSENPGNAPNTNISQPEVPEFLNITWRLSFSGRSPSKIVLSEKLQESNHESFYGYTWDPSAGNYRKSEAHNAFEMINGLIHDGKASEDSHPRRKLFFSSVLVIISALTWLLDLHYWYTCTSTTTLSVSGNAMVSVASLADIAFSFVVVAQQIRPHGFVPWTWLLLRKVLSQVLTPIFMLKAVLRLDFGWSKIVPYLKRLRPSQSERHSERVEAKTPWIARGGILIFLTVAYWLLTPEEMYLIEPTAPIPTPEEVPRYNIRIFTSSLHWTGSYRTTIMLHVLEDFTSLLFHLPDVMGRVQFHWGIPADWVFGMMIRVLLAFQAVMYAPHKAADETEKM